MKKVYKICFLGDAQVGKTTFLAALHRASSAESHFEVPFNDRYETAKQLETYAQDIESKQGLPATTSVSHFRGTLVWGLNEKVEIEFIDIPEDDFQQGYLHLDQEEVKRIRPFINQCDYLYFIFDPQRLLQGKNIFDALIAMLRDYYSSNKRKAALCLVLNKIDRHPEYKGDAGLQLLRQQLRDRYGEDLDVMRQYATLHLSTASAYGKEGNELGLSAEMFDDLFSPLRDLKRSHARGSCLSKLLLSGLLSIALAGGGYLFYEWEKQRVLQEGASTTGILETRENKEAYVEKQLQDLFQQHITDKNLPALSQRYKALATQQPDFASRIKRNWTQKLQDYKLSLEDRIDNTVKQLRNHSSQDRWNEYLQLSQLYSEHIDHTLPEALRLSYEEVFGLPKIDSILAQNYRGNPHAYVQSRVSAIRAYLNTKPAKLNETQEQGIERALALAGDFLNDKSYTVEIEGRGLSSDYDIFYTLQIGNDGNTHNTTKSKVYDDSSSARTPRLAFRWNIAHRVKVTMMHETFFITDDDDELADIWRDTSMSSLSLALLASDTWQKRSHAFDSDANGVEFRFKLYNDKGQQLQASDCQLVIDYILSNEFWEQLRQSLESHE